MTPSWPREFGPALLIGAALPLAFCLLWTLMLAAPPETNHGPLDYWLGRYQGALGGVATLIAAFLAYRAVRRQTGELRRQHDQRLRAEYGRDLDRWRSHDGNLLPMCRNVEKEAYKALAYFRGLEHAEPKRGGVLSAVFPDVVVPPEPIPQINWWVDVDTRTQGASPETVDSFRRLDGSIAIHNEQLNQLGLARNRLTFFGAAEPTTLDGFDHARIVGNLQGVVAAARFAIVAIRSHEPRWIEKLDA